MKEWGDCRGGRSPNIDQGVSVAMRQRGACAKVERKARTRRDFSAFFARCAIAYRKFTLPDGFGSLAWALEHAASGSLASSRAYACALVRRLSIFAFTPSPACRNPHIHNAIRVKALLVFPSPAPSHRHRWFGLCFQCTVSPPAGAMTRAELVRSHSATGERRGEGSPPQAFTLISLWFNNLRNMGEEVKGKNRN